MFERIFLHVGLHKTGTSTLQACFYQHRESLAEALSVHYPSLDANHSEALYSAFTADPVAYARNIERGLTTKAAVENYNHANLEALEAGFRAASTRYALLSGETVSHLQAEELERLRVWLEGFASEVQVVCALRDPVSWSVSEAQSQIRGGATFSRVNSRPQHQRIRHKLENLEAAFGREAISLLVFEDLVRHPEGPVGAFLEGLGFPATWAADHRVAVHNPSMSLEAAWLASAINARLPPIVDGKPGAGRRRGDLERLVAAVPGQKFAISLQARRRVAEKAAPDLAWLQERYGVSLPCEMGDQDIDGESAVFSQAAVDAVALELLRASQPGQGEVQAETDLARGLPLLEGDLASALEQLAAMEQSLSWRLTAPLRALKGWLSGSR